MIIICIEYCSFDDKLDGMKEKKIGIMETWKKIVNPENATELYEMKYPGYRK